MIAVVCVQTLDLYVIQAFSIEKIPGSFRSRNSSHIPDLTVFSHGGIHQRTGPKT